MPEMKTLTFDDVTYEVVDASARTTANEAKTTAAQALSDAKTYADNKIAAIPTPDVSGQINTHNADTSAHADIRTALDGKAATGHKHTKSEITDFPTSMPASDVSAWAKAASKPTYTASEVGADASGTAASAVSAHNTSTSAHADVLLPKSGGKMTGALDVPAVGKDGYIAYPDGGYFGVQNGGNGKLKITLPVTGDTNTMLRFNVKFYSYYYNTSGEYEIDGFLSGGWSGRYNAKCSTLSKANLSNLPVHFCVNGNERYVLIGDDNTDWSYTQVAVTDVVLGASNTNYDKWKSGWKVGVTTEAIPSGSYTITYPNVRNALTASDVGAASTATYTVSVPVSWSANSAGGYMQTVSVSGILATDNPIADIILGSDVDANASYLEAWACVTRITTAANSITLYANGDAPATAFTCQLKAVR